MQTRTVTSKPAEAVTFTTDNADDLVSWISETSALGKAIAQGERLYVPTLAGTKIAALNDIVVRDVIGDFQTYTPEEFSLRYDDVTVEA